MNSRNRAYEVKINTYIIFVVHLSRTELSHVVQERAEGPKAPSPGHRPGLGASALSGRVGAFLIASALYLSLRPVTVGSGRVELTCET